LFLLLTAGAWGQQADIPKSFTPPTSDYDYEKREVMIPMRDGVKLHTVIVVPKGARNAPILLTRTPYNASKRASRNESPHMLATLPLSDEVFVNDGYIRVYQDVRGKYKSEGAYLMTRPVRGPLNDSSTDHVTDAYDTAMDIFRGRYRDSFEHPLAIPAGKTQEYKFTLPTVNHVFEPGHRIMVQKLWSTEQHKGRRARCEYGRISCASFCTG